jgi:hypothetical protein
MEAAKRLVDEGERGLRGVEEKGVVVAADEAIEGSELFRRKALGVPGCDMMVLEGSLSAHVPGYKMSSCSAARMLGRWGKVLCNLQSHTAVARRLESGSYLA